MALMERIRVGDDMAFEQLVARHQRAVFNFALRFLNSEAEAEDITQETFLRVFRASKSYRPDAKFTTWLYTIVKNLSFNVLRKRRSAEVLSIDDEMIPDVVSPGDTPLTGLERGQIRARVVKAVGGLPDNMRLAVILQKFHGLQYEEIARVMNCSVNAVKLRVHRAKAILGRELKDLADETK